MMNFVNAFVLVLVLLLVPLQAVAAEDVKLRHVASAYVDDTGKGLKFPEGVACDGQHLYVADTGNNRIVRYVYGETTLVADKIYPLNKGVPLQVQVTSANDILYLDGKERQIVRLDAAGNLKGPLVFKGTPGTGDVVPKSFRIGANDQVYVLDLFGERVLVTDSKGSYLKQVPFPQDYGFFSDLALDARGAVYLVDSVNAAIYKATPNADQFSRLSTDLKKFMNFPTFLAPDNKGRLYVIDQYGSGLALIAADGSFEGRKLGLGWEDGFLYYPTQICFSGQNDIFVADRSNSRVQQFHIRE